MGEYAEDELDRFHWVGERDYEDDDCQCIRPIDNDNGYCMMCDLWINYRNNP